MVGTQPLDPLDFPSFLDRRAPTPATDPEAAGGADKATAASIADGVSSLNLGPVASVAGPDFSTKG